MLRKKPVWIAAVALFASAAIVVALSLRSPYSFLDRFHPTQIAAPHPEMMAADRSGSFMLVFDEKDAVSVLGALRRHLAKRGLYEYNDIPRGRAGSEMWTFNSPGGDIVRFASGFAGALRKVEFLYPRTPLLTPAIQELGSACVVVVDRRESWLDVRLRGLRRFLGGASS